MNFIKTPGLTQNPNPGTNADLSPGIPAPGPSTLAPHESLELHEALNFKTLCLAKSKLLQGLVFDEDLKRLMQRDVEQSIQDIAELQAVYASAPFRAPVPVSRPTPIINGEGETG